MVEGLKNLGKAEKYLLVSITVLGLLGGGILAEKYFLPENAVEVDESLPVESSEDAAVDNQSDTEASKQSDNETGTGSVRMEILKQGDFEGKTGHRVSGSIKLVEVDGENYLRFENYEQTQGPDVFVYLTPSEDPDTSEEISEGVKIRIDGGPDGGEIVKEGNFNQKIPDDIDVSNYNGVGVWCDAFSTPFGAAALN